MTTEGRTMTGPEAYAKAVEYALEADRLISDGIYQRRHDRAAAFAATSQAFAAIATAAAPPPAPAPVAAEPGARRRRWLPTRRTKTA
ncbi:hypothetical protein ACFCV8_08165 [Streptomyces sp. NPDC056347]|uniref:hypothetical protein n=1 Tax=Streptomyces sp. NPDC056347 TaxID=3345790 RepID=UPI0035E022CE